MAGSAPAENGHAHSRAPPLRHRAARVRPASEGRCLPDASHRWRPGRGERGEAPRTRRHRGAGPRHHVRRPIRASPPTERTGPRLLGGRPGPLPLQRLPPARQHGDCVPRRPHRHPVD